MQGRHGRIGGEGHGDTEAAGWGNRTEIPGCIWPAIVPFSPEAIPNEEEAKNANGYANYYSKRAVSVYSRCNIDAIHLLG